MLSPSFAASSLVVANTSEIFSLKAVGSEKKTFEKTVLSSMDL